LEIGAVFPQTEIGSDPGAIREYAQAAESLGYDHIIAFDHVLGANAGSRPDWSGAYRHTDSFHEPFVLFGYLAGVTERIGLVTSVIILPQRQTVLVAKQAAAIDVLSKGRLRLGIGIGWNAVEYEALGENFHDRGRRSEEQVELLRKLWTSDLVTFEGRWHTVTDAGINPLPVQRPIPLWFGGSADRLLSRVARLGDGWFPLFRPDDDGRALVQRMRDLAADAGRGPDDIGIETWVSIRGRPQEEWMAEVEAWKAIGATHVSVNTMNAGLESPQAHIDAIARFKDAVG
jgi:probable F420-dependent oxidoreductase